MGFIIEGGKGNGYSAGVNSENQLLTSAITQSIEHHVNTSEGEAYSLPIQVSADAADDCVFYLKNNNDKPITIEGLTFAVHTATANDSVYFKLGDSGTRDAATDVVPVNLNTGSGNKATGDFETGVHLNDGTLDGGTEFERLLITGTEKDSGNFNFPQDVIVPKNGVFTIYIGGSGTGQYFMTVNFHYHE